MTANGLTLPNAMAGAVSVRPDFGGRSIFSWVFTIRYLLVAILATLVIGMDYW